MQVADIPVLLVEQNADVCFELTDHDYHLHRGEIRMAGSAAELGNATEEIERYLGVRVGPVRPFSARSGRKTAPSM